MLYDWIGWIAGGLGVGVVLAVVVLGVRSERRQAAAQLRALAAKMGTHASVEGTVLTFDDHEGTRGTIRFGHETRASRVRGSPKPFSVSGFLVTVPVGSATILSGHSVRLSANPRNYMERSLSVERIKLSDAELERLIIDAVFDAQILERLGQPEVRGALLGLTEKHPSVELDNAHVKLFLEPSELSRAPESLREAGALARLLRAEAGRDDRAKSGHA